METLTKESLGKVTVFAGESGSGKSYFCAGNIVKEAQKQGIFVVLLIVRTHLMKLGYKHLKLTQMKKITKT